MTTRIRGSTLAAAADGRSPFVDFVLNDLAAKGRTVADDVRAYILKDVLVPDEKWDLAMTSGELDVERTEHILIGALNHAFELAQQNELRLLEEVHDPFYEVIHDRWNCPFPFVFC